MKTYEQLIREAKNANSTDEDLRFVNNVKRQLQLLIKDDSLSDDVNNTLNIMLRHLGYLLGKKNPLSQSS
jgi:hypothetical protein